MVRVLDLITQCAIPSRLSLAADRHFLQAIGRRSRQRRGVLRVYGVPGDLLGLGRYHPVPGTEGGSSVHRRFSGGRAIPFGDGFVGVALVLPHRSALVSDDPMALAPQQVINRCVRGIIEGCKLGGVAAFYPGRDFVTVDRRVLALVSFETDRAGALLFEAIIANQRSFAILPQLLDRIDPTGVVKAEMLPAATCLATETGRTLTIQEVAELLRQGYEKQFGLACEPHEPSLLEAQAIDAAAMREQAGGDDWLHQRDVRPDLTHHAMSRVQLGMFEAHFSLEQGRLIKDILFTGDFIANSSGLGELERALRLCPAEWRAIDAVASEILSRPENFILGIGRVHVIADTICEALPA